MSDMCPERIVRHVSGQHIRYGATILTQNAGYGVRTTFVARRAANSL